VVDRIFGAPNAARRTRLVVVGSAIARVNENCTPGHCQTKDEAWDSDMVTPYFRRLAFVRLAGMLDSTSDVGRNNFWDRWSEGRGAFGPS
jgi:hypothetical protein